MPFTCIYWQSVVPRGGKSKDGIGFKSIDGNDSGAIFIEGKSKVLSHTS